MCYPKKNPNWLGKQKQKHPPPFSKDSLDNSPQLSHAPLHHWCHLIRMKWYCYLLSALCLYLFMFEITNFFCKLSPGMAECVCQWQTKAKERLKILCNILIIIYVQCRTTRILSLLTIFFFFSLSEFIFLLFYVSGDLECVVIVIFFVFVLFFYELFHNRVIK